MSAGVIVSGIIIFIVHLFLAYRIRQLIHAPLWSAIAWVVVVLSVLLLGLGIYSTWAVNNGDVIQLNGNSSVHWVAIANISIGSALDLFIALTICYQLYQVRSGVKSTQGIINTITLYMITSGMITMFAFLFCIFANGTDHASIEY
ncbi:hypothetical protein V5O48_009301 [Marasmius crinis-equi]|uniref:DUF6534 domain-containing protein n=1 Tax=Marasmius crinis-equi TaxID=585013 RepID=A0ABR3FC21_9AGAR